MSLQDLQKRIEVNKAKQSVVAETNPFKLYLSHYNITNGVDRIPTYVLYYCYSLFIAKSREDLPLSRIVFYKTLKRFIQPIRWGKQRYYLIDKTVLKIDEEMIFKAKLCQKEQTRNRTTNAKKTY